ncbi:MAG: hypothetical protein CVV64_12400 [Candidatus Wallbacteria bacterium HGW-Wallbacteria-1]|jgi:hypothetical protein|uniref:Uncharacterized protein n=1 Tax=Candidatus Wallbacteria bacterium HGW-Wallbacteria-1 TaxID=2013854 RepID=A0A2N1PN87_9BACT|nr:MAG: hypothetical protein CVV64_12400 [Candidatus Wallbacteria bacterium HGW-Wallbacteria-1]
MRGLVSKSLYARALMTFILSVSILLISPGILENFDAFARELPVSADAVAPIADPSSTTPPAVSKLADTGAQTAGGGTSASDAAQTVRITPGSVVTIDQKIPDLKAKPVGGVVAAAADTTRNVTSKVVTAVKSDVGNIISGKEMSKLEKILWSIGKAVVPTIAVIAFAATVACPVTWLVVGTIAIGALAGGGMSLLADWRANHFKEDGKKKASVDMFRDASIAAVTNAVAAPFTLIGGSLVAQAGKFTMLNVAKSAALQGATSFVSGVASKAAGGATLNLWDKNYYKKGEQAEKKQAELDAMLSKYEQGTGDIPPEELARMEELMAEIDELKKGTYDTDDFKKDVSGSAVDGVIGGFLGGIGTHFAANTKIAKRASMALFKNTKNAGSVAQVVVSNPFNFASGASKARIEQVLIEDDIKDMQKQRDALPADSPARKFYDSKINILTKQRDDIDIWRAGTDQMVNSLITNSVGLGVSVAKTRLYDIPKAKKAAVNQDYRKENGEWQKAGDAKSAYLTRKGSAPKRADFANDADFDAAVAQHRQEVASLKSDWKSAEKAAVASDKLPENKAVRDEISKRYDTNKAIDERLEIARIYGDEAYKKARVELVKENGKVETWKDGRKVFVIREKGKIKKRIELDPNDPDGSLNAKLDDIVTQSIKSEYAQKVVSTQKSIDDMEAKMKDYQNLKENGKLETWSDGTRHFIVRNEKGQMTRNITINPKVKNWQNDPQIKQIEAAGLTVKPSAYKAAIVQKRIAELKTNGASDAEIRSATAGFVKDADTAMVQNFGGSMWDCVKHEALAGQLSKVQFDGMGTSTLKTKISSLLSKQPDAIRKGLVNEYVKEVNAGINEELTPHVATGSSYGDKALKSLIERSVTTTTGIISDETQDAVGGQFDRVLQGL